MNIVFSILALVFSVLLVAKNAVLYTDGGTAVKWYVFVTGICAIACGGMGIVYLCQ